MCAKFDTCILVCVT